MNLKTSVASFVVSQAVDLVDIVDEVDGAHWVN